jgi:uncharacterized protein YigE (DUF2233 family)
MVVHSLFFVFVTVFPTETTPATLVVNGRAERGFGAPSALIRQDGAAFVALDRLDALAGVQRRSAESVTWFGRELRFACGSKRYWVTGMGCGEVAIAPFASGGVWLPCEMLEAAFGWKLRATGGEVQLWGPGAAVVQVRQGTHPDRCRVVLDLSQTCVFQPVIDKQQVTVAIAPPSSTSASAGELQVLEFDSSVVPRVTLEVAQDGWTQVTVPTLNRGDVQLLTLPDPPRIVIDVMLPREQAERETGGTKKEPSQAAPLSPVTLPAATSTVDSRAPATTPKPAGKGSGQESIWRTMEWPTGAGPATVHVVIVDPSSKKVELRPALGGPLVRSLSSVAYIAKVHGALAAVNGGFFSPHHKVPLGMLVIDGEWMRAPLPCRPVLLISKDGKCEIRRVEFDGRVYFEGLGFLPILGLNQNHWEPDSVVVFTHRWGSSVPEAANTVRLVVSARNRVVYRESGGKEVPLPAGGMVISGSGRRAEALSKVPLGREVKLSLSIKPEWPELWHALGGGPLLISDGKVVLDAKAEGFRSDVTDGRQPRTAVGVLGDGRVAVVTAEGAPLGRGPGLSLWELTNLMAKLGAKSAMNLDGGSSTTLVVDGQVVTKCSAGFPRLVNNALIVVPVRAPTGG